MDLYSVNYVKQDDSTLIVYKANTESKRLIIRYFPLISCCGH